MSALEELVSEMPSDEVRFLMHRASWELSMRKEHRYDNLRKEKRRRIEQYNWRTVSYGDMVKFRYHNEAYCEEVIGANCDSVTIMLGGKQYYLRYDRIMEIIKVSSK